MLLAVETVARVAESEVRPHERKTETPALRPSRPGGRPPWGGLVVLAVLAALAGAGWIYRDAAGPMLAPVLARLGLAAPAPAPPPQESAAPADPNLVTLDEAGQTRIGLAFGRAETRRIVLPVRAPGTSPSTSAASPISSPAPPAAS